MFAIQFEMLYVFHENLFKPSVVMFLTLVPRVAVNNLRAECDVNNEAKILRIEIVFAILKPAVKSETVECNYTKNRWL